MNLSELCSDRLVTVQRSTSIVKAAQLMRDSHVGSVIVMSDESPRQPVGILTDRDIVLRVVAVADQKTVVSVGQVMSEKPVCAPETTGIFEAIQLMRDHGVRRLLVSRDDQKVKGIVSLDDLLPVFTDEMSSMANAIAKGLLHEEAKV